MYSDFIFSFFLCTGEYKLKSGCKNKINDNIQVSHYFASVILLIVSNFFVIGVIGMPPGVVYGAPVFPGQLLTPMMQPRFR